MKTMKKTVSLILAVCMIISTTAIAFSAFALSSATTKAVEAITALSADKTNINTKAPTDETKLAAYNGKLALYNSAVAAYKALSVEEKDAFDVALTLQMLKAVNEREAFVIKDAYDSKLPSTATWQDKMSAIESRVQAAALLDEKLGEHPARTQTLEFGNKYLGTKYKCSDGTMQSLTANSNFTKYPELVTAAKEYIAAYKAAPKLVRMYLDGYGAAFMSFSANVVGTNFTNTVKIAGKAKTAENPYIGGAKPAITNKKPNAKNFDGGATNPEYISALELYLKDKKASIEYDQAVKLHEYNFYIKAIKDFKESLPEVKTACEVALALYDGYFEFDMTGNTNKAKIGMNAYDAMTDSYDCALYKAMGSIYLYYLIYLNAKKDDYSYNNLAIKQLYEKCQETAGMSMISEFEKWVMTVDIDKVDNSVVSLAETKYNELPKSLINKLSSEAGEQYVKIIALYEPTGPIVPSDYTFANEISNFSSVNGLAAIPGVNKAFDILATVENYIFTIAYAAAIGTLLTNDNIKIVGSLYDYLANANITVSGMNISPTLAKELKPSDIAGFLIEDKYAGARSKLLAAAEINDTTSAYANIKFESGDWGFEDGDAAGFANALAAALRPATDMIHNGVLVLSNIIYLPNSTTDKGDYCYGAYEELIPILEGIGLEGVISSQEYTDNFYKSQKGEAYDYLDSLILPILEPVVNLISKLEDNVVFTLFDIIPNIARTIDNDILNTQLASFLGKSSLLSGIKVDLSGDAINEMISGISFTLPINNLFKVKIALKAFDWNRLSRCGELVLANSVSASNLYRTTVSADRAKVQENIAKNVSISF